MGSNRIWRWMAALTVSMGLVNAQQPPAPKSQPLSLRYENVRWEKIVPDFGDSSPEIAILRVDAETKATQLLIRVPKQFHVPMHWHSANETHTILKGTWVFECDGKRDRLGPGSFNYIPAHMPHQAWATAGAVVIITVDAGWDINWVNGPPTRNDFGQPLPTLK
jgi:mannose-6-phosphate isomerase-like protein (cupin superfamily)